jgi:quercetin dioxygenase-like cupin family protein
MKIKTIRAVSASAAFLSLAAVAHSAEPGVMAISPSEMKWSAQGGLALPGLEQTTLIGDPSKPGPYTIRLKFPAGFKVAPHTHPDSREVTVLSGTWYTGYGEKADATGLKELPAGSFYTEPANIAHYVQVREPTVIQVSGTGPSGRKFVGPDAPK